MLHNLQELEYVIKLLHEKLFYLLSDRYQNQKSFGRW